VSAPVETEIKLRTDGPDAARAVTALGRARSGAGTSKTTCSTTMRRLRSTPRTGPAPAPADGRDRHPQGAAPERDGHQGPAGDRDRGLDGDAFHAILTALGTARSSATSHRETYRWREVEIVIDETPIGTYLEIEGPVDVIHEAARALGRGPADYIGDSYAALFLASGGIGDMVFK
jgi:hypothetical protein